MTEEGAVAFLDRVEDDEGFARELGSLRHDPGAVLETVQAAGFDATPDEIREAFIERYGAELTQEQLDEIAAGTDPGVIAAAAAGGSVAAVAIVFGAVAAAF